MCSRQVPQLLCAAPSPARPLQPGLPSRWSFITITVNPPPPVLRTSSRDFSVSVLPPCSVATQLWVVRIHPPSRHALHCVRALCANSSTSPIFPDLLFRVLVLMKLAQGPRMPLLQSPPPPPPTSSPARGPLLEKGREDDWLPPDSPLPVLGCQVPLVM